MLQTLILNSCDVERLLPMASCIDLMAEALLAASSGEAIFPLRTVLRVPGRNAFLGSMPAVHAVKGVMGTKLISVFPENHGTGLPSHLGVVLLFDARDGRLLALLDASSLTAIRTAAASAVATRLLARSNARALTILGSGVQARSHVQAMLAVRPIKEVRVWSRNIQHAEGFAADVQCRYDIKSLAFQSARQAVQGADIICTVTAAQEPILSAAWLPPGVHINAVGACTPTTREIDGETIARARVFVDSRESAWNEAGDLLIPLKEGRIEKAHVQGEVGEILLNKVAGRESEEQLTLFKSLGIGAEDLLAADAVYRAAQKRKLGVSVAFSAQENINKR